MKKSSKNLHASKSSVSLLPKYILQSWANKFSILFKQDKGNACYGGLVWKRPTAYTPVVKCTSHLRWAFFVIAILNKMKYIKNYTRECYASFPDASVNRLAAKGGQS